MNGNSPDAPNWCLIKAKVLNVTLINKFDGNALLAGILPKFVVTLLFEDKRTQYGDPGSEMSFPVYPVAFFAVDSVVKIFLESEIVNQVFNLRVEKREVNGIVRYWLELA